MATYDITSEQLGRIGFYKVMRNYLLFPRKGWHIRLDQKPIARGGVLSVEYVDQEGRGTGVWGYRISSFHIKREEIESFTSVTEGPYLGKKIVEEDTKYVYFVYAGGFVWQPIWGYGKLVQKHQNEPIWQPDNSEIDAGTWAFACEEARHFLRKMKAATGDDHGLAMGPIQGAEAHLFWQL